MPKDPSEVLLPHIEALLAPGESLQGWVIATEQSTFSGNMVVLGVTDQRLILQGHDDARQWRHVREAGRRGDPGRRHRCTGGVAPRR